MDRDRAVGHLIPPTREQVADYAADHGLSASPEGLTALQQAVTQSLLGWDHLESLEEPVVPLRHCRRDPGRPPTDAEDPYRAIIRWCDVPGA
jgi:amidase